MNATSIYNLLQSKGLILGVVGDKIRISPPELINDEVKALMQEHKADLIAEVRRRAEMITLDELPDAALAIKVHSRVLGEDIYLVSGSSMLDMLKAEGLVAYTPSELKEIYKAHPGADGLRQIHEIKKQFHGSIINRGKRRKENRNDNRRDPDGVQGP